MSDKDAFAATIPAAAQRLSEVFGAPLTLEVDLDAFDDDPNGGKPLFQRGLAKVAACFESGAFAPLRTALDDVTVDPQQARLMRERLRGIRITPSNPNTTLWGEARFQLDEGLLEFEANVFANLGGYQDELNETLVRALRSGL